MRNIQFAAILSSGLAASSANATYWDYTYEGHLAAGTMLGGTTLAAPTAFTLYARFDDTTTNLAAPIGVAGFVAYAPTWATLTVASAHYGLKSWDGTSGVAVSIFDETTPFGNGHVASGIIQDIPNDGAGIVGDWLKSTPEIFSGGKLEAFRMTGADFFGVGFGAGSISATLGGVDTTVTLLNADLTYQAYQFVGPPFTPFRDFASLTLAPEPGVFALFGLSAVAVAVARRRKG